MWFWSQKDSSYEYLEDNLACYNPAAPKAERGYTGFTLSTSHLSVFPSVHPSLCRQGFHNILKKLSVQFISYLTFPSWMSLLKPILFSVFCINLSPLVTKYLAKRGFLVHFEKLLAQFFSYLTFTYMGCVSWSLFILYPLSTILAIRLPNIWLKIFPEIFEKTIGSINFIPGIYHNGKSLDSYLFRGAYFYVQPSGDQIFDQKQGFWNFLKILSAQFISYLTIMEWVFDPFSFLCSHSQFRPCGGKIFRQIWGFRNLKKNTISSIDFIPGIYLYGACLLTLVHFRNPIIKICPLVAKYMVSNGVSRIFWKKKHWLSSSYLTIMG